MENIVVYLFLLLFFTIYVVLKALLFLVRYFNIRSSEALLFEEYHHFLELTALSFLWYSISLSFTLYNKWILQQWQGGFNFPIIITTTHMIVKTIATRIWGCSSGNLKELPWKLYATIAIPIGALTAADIVFSNASIMFLPLSLYTTIKGSALIFTYLWGVVCKVESFDWPIFSAVTTICVGIGIAVSSTVDVNFLGVFLALSSAACGGLRWVLLQVMVEADERSLKSPMTALYHFTPPSAASILPFALLVEGPRLMRSEYATSEMISGETLMLITLGGMISLVLIVVEVVLLQLTSSLTLSVIGQMKEILQIVIAMFLFDESIRWKSAFGIALSILGSYFYKQLHISDMHGSSSQSVSTAEDPDEFNEENGSGSAGTAYSGDSGLEMLDRGMMRPMQIQSAME